MFIGVCAAIRCIRGMSRPRPHTVGSTMVLMPLAYTALSLSMASGDHGLLVPPVAAVVLHVLGGKHEDVLVHQGLAQVAQVDRAPHGLDDCHSDPLSDGCAEPFKGLWPCQRPL